MVCPRLSCPRLPSLRTRVDGCARWPGTGLWIQLPEGLSQTQAPDGSQVFVGAGVTLSVRAVGLGGRGLANHFRKVAAQSGAEATGGSETCPGGHCGDVRRGRARVATGG